MRKYIIVLLIALATQSYALDAAAADVFQQYDKVIWINQIEQRGEAYEEGEKLCEFPVVTGDDETTTDPGIYVVKLKDENYYSRKYDTPMPFSIFFDLKERKAIHEGEVPPPAMKKELATHGCVHVEQPYIEWLFDWAEVGKTVVVIYGGREEN
jgi:lipoprotein-anchoring transpeptidase ErfK/SrfK